MKNNKLLLVPLALVLLAVVPAAARADPITLALPSSVTLQAGGSITVIGTLSNGGAPDFNISSWTLNLSDPLLTFDDTAFFASPLVLPGGSTYGPTGFFDVFADVSLAPGAYLGTFTVSDLIRNVSVTQTFVINVDPANQVVPEPASMLLLGSGLGGLLLARRRRKQKTSS